MRTGAAEQIADAIIQLRLALHKCGLDPIAVELASRDDGKRLVEIMRKYRLKNSGATSAEEILRDPDQCSVAGMEMKWPTDS